MNQHNVLRLTNMAEGSKQEVVNRCYKFKLRGSICGFDFETN